MNVRELLIEPLAHIAPARALESLTVHDAHQRVPGTSHSIAQIVAHLIFWQEWFCERCAGVQVDMPSAAAIGWPEVTDGTWPMLERRFLEGLERAASYARSESSLDRAITPPIEFPPLKGYSIRDALIHIAHHNTHHLGQIVLLRQLLGSWPPPSGSYTW